MKKRFPIVIAIVFLLLLTACGNGSTTPEEPDFFSGRTLPLVIQSGELSIHFLELGNKFTGDCVYINYNEIDILIDAGSNLSSIPAIKKYIDQYIKDNKLEYVIATHAHADHIWGFINGYSGGTPITGILDSYEIGMIIDFPLTNMPTLTTGVLNSYRTIRDRLAAETDTVHFTALQCYNEEGGAKKIYDLGNDVKLEILYNYYYENHSEAENDYSVCVRILQGHNQYIFTGDLEAVGEIKLVEYYNAQYGGLGQCVLYKGGHHGSNTSSSVELMAAIRPEYVCVCTCAGTYEYNFNVEANRFPSQGFINRVAPHTDRVYITTLITDYENNQYTSFNGDIVFLVSNGRYGIICSNNNLKLKDTEWFRKTKVMPPAWMPR